MKSIKPGQIEVELEKMWSSFKMASKRRENLFNLVVFTKLSARVEYIREIVQRVIRKFPCRIIFIISENDTGKSYLKAAVNIAVSRKEMIACDNIEIRVAGREHQSILFFILSHLLPDLPIYLLWAEDPIIENPLFGDLKKIATRLIFDSEIADSLISFAQVITRFSKENTIDIADLNWARTEGWRDLLNSCFHTPQRVEKLKRSQDINITYNIVKSKFFCHPRIKAVYLQTWLATCLNWKLKDISGDGKSLFFAYQNEERERTISLIPIKDKKLTTGAITKITFTTDENQIFHFYRNKNIPHKVSLDVVTQESCEVPCHYFLEKSAIGLALIKEIYYRGTSQHYLEMLKLLQNIKNPLIC